MAPIPIVHTHAVTRSPKASEKVARDLVHRIVADGLQPGDGLPTEASMIDELGVSRESLREGLRLLEVQGLLAIRRGPGGGPSVGAVDPANLGRVSSLYYRMAGATYRELFEAWVFAECSLVERAARHADAAARRAAMEPYLRSGPDPSEPLAEFHVAQTGFHADVARLADNRILELTLQAVAAVMSHHFFLEEDTLELRDMVEVDHVALAAAVADGRVDDARSMMADHLGRVAEHSSGFGRRLDDLVDWI